LRSFLTAARSAQRLISSRSTVVPTRQDGCPPPNYMKYIGSVLSIHRRCRRVLRSAQICAEPDVPDEADERPSPNGAGGAERRRFTITPENLLDVIQPPSAEDDEPPVEADDPEHALGRRIARLDYEPEFATLFLTLDGGGYLTYAARIDEDEGIVLADIFTEESAAYDEYLVPDEQAGETGTPPPDRAPEPGTPFHPDAWKQAEGRTLGGLGWYEEGMQAFLHFDEGGYLTLAARAAGGVAYLVGYFSAVDPESDDEYLLFEPPGGEGE
jgi:hypothetical protein